MRSSMTALVLLILLGALGCSRAANPATKAESEEEAIARTEFTERIENFFEYEPLKKGKSSQFLIHLTDLTDGSPVENAEVTLTIRRKANDTTTNEIKARVGKVTGIYVADVSISNPGEYNIVFHVKNNKLDERLALTDFKVE